MINLRYHIVSLTAVFLAIGIGLTLGSTFLDRATVENLNGQLENLEERLGDRETRINELEEQVAGSEALQTELDEQAVELLAGRVEELPVVVLASRGVDEADVQGAVQALVVAGADLQGLWWFTDRWVLDDQSEIDDLAVVLDEDTTDPSRLRRMAVDQLGGELRSRQLLPAEIDEADPATGESDEADGGEGDGGGEGTTDTDQGAGDPGTPEDPVVEDDAAAAGDALEESDGTIEVLDDLVENGFVEYEVVAGGPETPRYPDGTRLLLVGGSPDVPDDLLMEPLVSRMGRATTTPILAVATSAVSEESRISDLVEVIRQHEQLSELISTVDDVEHFDGWAAMVLALADAGDADGIGHYGLDETATRLLPPLRSP